MTTATLTGSPASAQSGTIGIGFAVRVSVVKSITDQRSSGDPVPNAQLGVKVLTASVRIGDATETAATVDSVQPHTGAAKAGLKRGDAIIAVDDHQVVSSDALVGYVRTKTVGDHILLTVVRDGKQQKLTVQLGKAS